MSLKIGVVGTGYISHYHARAAQALPGVELTAVVNHRHESMAPFAATYNIPRQYLTVEALLAEGGIDAVSINTPNSLHAPQAIAALDAGVHVLVEKPMAVNAAQAKEMQAASRRSGAHLMVAHCWRFDEEVLWLKGEASRLGRIIRTTGDGVHVNWGPGGWFTQKALAGGGALADMGIHAIDTARFLLDDPYPVSVWAKIGTYYTDHDVDDTGSIIINWDNGAFSQIESGWWQPHAGGPEANTQLYGTRGFGSLFPTRLSLPNPEKERVDEVVPGYPHPRDEHCPQLMYDTQMAYFIDCIRNNRTPNPGGAEGLINMLIVDAAYQSSLSGELVAIA